MSNRIFLSVFVPSSEVDNAKTIMVAEELENNPITWNTSVSELYNGVRILTLIYGSDMLHAVRIVQNVVKAIMEINPQGLVITIMSGDVEMTDRYLLLSVTDSINSGKTDC